MDEGEDICIRGCDEGALIVGANEELLRSKFKRVKATPWGVVLLPPMVLERVVEARKILERRGKSVRIAPELRINKAVSVIEEYLEGGLSIPQVVGWVKALEVAMHRVWWPASVRLQMVDVLEKLRRKMRGKSFGGVVIVREREWDALHASLAAKERQIQRLLED